MEVYIALGILVSEAASPAFANRCLTFYPLAKKVMKVRRADWGGNANLFVKATAKLELEAIPDLIVFSDMQFDQAQYYCMVRMIGKVISSESVVVSRKKV